MSIISFASPWTNDDVETPKKRTPANNIPRKTVKMRLSQEELQGASEYESESSKYKTMQPSSIDDIKTSNEEKDNRVNELLNKMNTTSFASSDSTVKMGEFNPPLRPIIQVKKDQSPALEPPVANATPTNFAIPMLSHSQSHTQSHTQSQPQFSSNVETNPTYSNYHTSYDEVARNPAPAYGVKNTVPNTFSTGDNRLMEKINYMIHMLENMESEKTANVTEEFILYSFLGIFVIFIVDSFSRGGKYVR